MIDGNETYCCAFAWVARVLMCFAAIVVLATNDHHVVASHIDDDTHQMDGTGGEQGFVPIYF